MKKSNANHKDTLNVANKIIVQLKELGIEAYIWHAANTGSVYVRFNDVRMNSIRLGDHDGREHLKYKWNLRCDNVRNGWVKDGEQWRFFLHISKWKFLIPELQKRHETIQTWPDSKFSYTIPKHKQEQQQPIFE